jgi:PadR family transcriptional regulator AphA
MGLSPTASVILGMLRRTPRSGYEIKQAVDGSTRFFWAASYGQIYPELRQLTAAGLIEGEAKPRGGRKRTVYRLTRKGRAALRKWLDEPTEVHELRDEGLLKLFFAAADPSAALQAVERKQHLHERKLAELREIEAGAEAAAAAGDPYPQIVLRCGIEFHQTSAGWCRRTRDELLARGDDEKGES